MKANHNSPVSIPLGNVVGIKERKYKVWKQITTPQGNMAGHGVLVSKNVNTKFESKSQHEI